MVARRAASLGFTCVRINPNLWNNYGTVRHLRDSGSRLRRHRLLRHELPHKSLLVPPRPKTSPTAVRHAAAQQQQRQHAKQVKAVEARKPPHADWSTEELAAVEVAFAWGAAAAATVVATSGFRVGDVDKG